MPAMASTTILRRRDKRSQYDQLLDDIDCKKYSSSVIPPSVAVFSPFLGIERNHFRSSGPKTSAALGSSLSSCSNAVDDGGGDADCAMDAGIVGRRHSECMDESDGENGSPATQMNGGSSDVPTDRTNYFEGSGRLVRRTKRPAASQQAHNTRELLEIEEELSQAEADSQLPIYGKRDTTAPSHNLVDYDARTVQTSSGLLLTHRKPPYEVKPACSIQTSIRANFPDSQQYFEMNKNATPTSSHRHAVEWSSPYKFMELEDPKITSSVWKWRRSAYWYPESFLLRRKSGRVASWGYAKIWLASFLVILFVSLGIAVVAVMHVHRSEPVAYPKLSSSLIPKDRILRQMDNTANTMGISQTDQTGALVLSLEVPRETSKLGISVNRALHMKESNTLHDSRFYHLRDAFDTWILHHNRSYSSHEEKNSRLQIWAANHERIQQLQEEHGPCTMTNQPVFGSNQFQDFTPKEFREHFLTGYTTVQHHSKESVGGEKVGKWGSHQMVDQPVMHATDPIYGVERHPTIQKLYEEHALAQQAKNGKRSLKQRFSETKPSRTPGYHQISMKSCWSTCQANPSCWFNCLLGYSLSGVMSPSNTNASPSSLDWRNFGVVTNVHSQGNCGACWAITAVETVESVYAISSGTLVDLAESEVIACDNSCQMCNGGWPQNAFEYVIKYKGLPADYGSWSYNGDYLLALTSAYYGGSDLSQEEVSSFQSQLCINTQDGADKSGTGSSPTRYGAIKGYGYATDRCVCYSNGQGCDCDSQNENLAIRNIASYGPAVVCIDASVWQYYSGGIMTSASGCSSKFLNMNHCVQAVGYVFTDGLDDESSQSNQGGKSHKSNDNNQQQREGYWIIRNQWSKSWGIRGYAYLAMGENTCGVLNDMTQAYMKD